MEKKGDSLETLKSNHDDAKHEDTQNVENKCNGYEVAEAMTLSNRKNKESTDAVITNAVNVAADLTNTNSSNNNQKESVKKATQTANQPSFSRETFAKEKNEQVRSESAEIRIPAGSTIKTNSHDTNKKVLENKTRCDNETCSNATDTASSATTNRKSENNWESCNDPHLTSHQPVESKRPSISESLSSFPSASMFVHHSTSHTHLHPTRSHERSSHSRYKPISTELTYSSSPSSSTSSLDRQWSTSMKWPHIQRSVSSPHPLRVIASQPNITPSAIHSESFIHPQNVNEGLLQTSNNNNITTNNNNVQETENNSYTHMNCKDNNINKSNAQRSDHEIVSGININVFKPSNTKYSNSNNISYNNNNNNNNTISRELIHASSRPQTPSESAQMRHMHISQLQRMSPSVLRSTHSASSPQLLPTTSHINTYNNNNNNNTDTSAVLTYLDDVRNTPRAQLAPPLSFESLHRNFATQDTSTNMSICTGRSTSSRWSTSMNTPREELSYPNTHFIHTHVQNTFTSNTSTQPSRQSVSPNVLLTPMPLPTEQQPPSISASNIVNSTTIQSTPHEENEELLLPISVVDLERQYTEEAASLSRDELEQSVCELRMAHRVQKNKLDHLEKKYKELERGLNAHFAEAEMSQEAISNHFMRERDKLEKRQNKLMIKYEQIEHEIEGKQIELQQVNSTIDKIERFVNREFNQLSMWEVTRVLQAQAANTKVERMLKDEKCTLQELEMLIDSLQSEQSEINENENESLSNTTFASRDEQEQQMHSSTEIVGAHPSTNSNKQQENNAELESRSEEGSAQRDDREITHILRDEIADLVQSKNELEKQIQSFKKSKHEISRKLRKMQEDKKREGDKVAMIERAYKDVKNTVKEKSTKLHFALEIESERLLNTRSITSFSNLEMPYGATPHHSQPRTPHRTWSMTRSNSSFNRSDPRATPSVHRQHQHKENRQTQATNNNKNTDNNKNEYDDRMCTSDYADDENDESDEEEWEAVNTNSTQNNNSKVTEVKQEEERINEEKNTEESDRHTDHSNITGENYNNNNNCKSNPWPLSFTSLLNASSETSSHVHSQEHLTEQLPPSSLPTESQQQKQLEQEGQVQQLSSTNATSKTQPHLSNAQDRINTYTSPADWLRQGAGHQQNTETHEHELFAAPLSLTSRHNTQRTINTNSTTTSTPSKDKTKNYSATSTLENNSSVALAPPSYTSFVQPTTQEHSESVDQARHLAQESGEVVPSQSHSIIPHHNVISVQETARMSPPHLLQSSEDTPQRVFCQDALDSITHLDLERRL